MSMTMSIEGRNLQIGHLMGVILCMPAILAYNDNVCMRTVLACKSRLQSTQN